MEVASLHRMQKKKRADCERYQWLKKAGNASIKEEKKGKMEVLRNYDKQIINNLCMISMIPQKLLYLYI